jgi:HD-GYP domain-containing protein (c-di-GMP phosphodiesterase class II)
MTKAIEILPEDILKKEGLLSQDEYSVMKTHSAAGADVIRDVNYFAAGSNIIRHHHERWDGKGYPDQIRGVDIPEGARIMAVADAFDAMTSDRPYRNALPPSVALKELKSCAGTQFDPKVVDAFIRIYPKLKLETVSSSPDNYLVSKKPIHSEAYH